MSLTCDCDYDPEPGMVCWSWSNDYSVLETKTSRTCCSCGTKLVPGDLVAAYPRFKIPEYDIEINIYGEWGDDGPSRATWYHCEECADLALSLRELGFCFDISDNMRGLTREYAEMYGTKERRE